MAKQSGCRVLRAIQYLKKSKALMPFIACFLALNLCIVASVAWFIINRQAYVDELGMGLAADDTSAVYKAFMYDIEKGMGTDTHPDGTELNVTNVNLNQYDTIFRSQNKYTPVIVQIRLVSSVSMPENGTVYITINRKVAKAQAESELDLLSSSVVRFTALVDSDEAYVESTDADALYRHINKKVLLDDTKTIFDEVEGYVGNDLPHSKTFVTVEGEGEGHTHGKVDSITVEATYTAGDWYENSEHNMCLNVYLYLTYDVPLIECFMEEQTGGGISLEDNFYSFENDLEMVRVSYAK